MADRSRNEKPSRSQASPEIAGTAEDLSQVRDTSPPGQEPAADANPDRVPEVEDTPEPPAEVAVVLDPEFEVSGDHPNEVAVTVTGVSADDDFTDEDGRLVVSSSPVKVPAEVAKALRGSPAVKVAD